MVHTARSGIASLVASAVLLRRLRVDRRFSTALMLAVCLSTLALAAIPRLLNQLSDAELAQTLRAAQRSQPAFSVSLRQRLPPGNTPLATIETKGAGYQAALAAPLRSVLNGNAAVAESPRFIVRGISGASVADCAPQFGVANPCLLNLRAQPSDSVRVISGRLPRPHAPVPPAAVPALTSGQPLPLVEIALTAKTAAALGLRLGDRTVIQPDPQDQLALDVPIELLNYHIVLQLVGLIAPVDPSALQWRGDTRLLTPDSNPTPNGRPAITAAALIAPGAYPQLLGLTAPLDWRYNWRFAIDSARVNQGNVGALSAALHSLQLSRGPAQILDSDPGRVSLQTSLPDTLDRYQQRRALVVGSLSLATVSILAVALALVAVLATLFAERRLAQTALLRTRGATRVQLGLAQFGEGLLLALPAASLGYALALLLIPARPSSLSLFAAVALALATPFVLLLGSLPSIRLPLGLLLGRRVDAPRATRARRLVLEALIVLLAVLGLVLLRRRGLTQSGGSSFDPYLALVPVLAGLAAGMLMLRLAPLPIRVLASLARSRRGLVPFVALRWVAAQTLAAWLPALVLLLAVGVTTLMVVLHSSLAQAQRLAAWQEAGADFRIDAVPGRGLAAGLSLAHIAGVRGIARAALVPNVVLSSGLQSQVSLLAIDTDDYTMVAAGTPAAPHFPSAMLGRGRATGLGSQSNPIPVIVSAAWPEMPAPGRGALLQPSLGSGALGLKVVAVRPSFPGLPSGTPFIVAPLQQIQASGLDSALTPNRLLLRGPARLQAPLQAALEAVAPNASLTALASVEAAMGHEPFLGGVTGLYWLSAGLVSLFAVAAILCGLLLTTSERVRDLGYLRTLGLSTRQLLGLTVIEQGLPVALASVIGAGLGLVLTGGVAPAIDLSALAGTRSTVALLINWPQLIGVIASLAALTLLLVLLVSLLLRRVNPSMILRGGDA